MSEERMLEHIHMMFKFHIMYVDLISWLAQSRKHILVE
jgi:hypothetical protein